MWANFHSHSRYCDGKGEVADYITSARKNNVFTLGISSHAPLPFECAWAMKKENLQLYFQDINKLKKANPDLEIYKSLEIDFIPGVISPFDYKKELDYLVGSIHFIDQLPGGLPWQIDGTTSQFNEGFSSIFKKNMRDVVTRYFELTREMIFASAPDIVGHLDKIKIQNTNNQYFSQSDQWYRDEVLKTLKLIQQADLIVEVNTRGIYQKKSNTLYPSPWILELIHQKNIPVTLSSDAHHPDDLVNNFHESATLLKEIGFETLSVLKEGKWKQMLFNENGIIQK